MKNFNWKKKFAAALAAAGLLSPAAVVAQCSLNTNLVVDGSFENVDTADIGPYGSARLIDWSDADGDNDDNFAYPYSLEYSGNPAPPGAGDYHFTGGFSTTAGEVQITQTIDLSTGACAAQIAGGMGFYNLSAFFSTYFEQNDSSTVRVRFLDSSAGELGVVDVGGADFRAGLTVTDGRADWGQDLAAGVIPTATRSLELQIIADVGVTNHDGYVDLVDFQVRDELTLSALDIRVDRDTGGLLLSNLTGAPVNLSGYSITSSLEALNPSNATWLSIADNYDADSGGTVDPNNVWSELSMASTFTDLSEADFTSGTGTILAPGATIVLSDSGGWIKNPFESGDLVFQYVSDLEPVTGIVTFAGNDGNRFEIGDFNVDGTIDADDWIILRDNQHSNFGDERLLAAYFLGDLNGDFLNNHTDFVLFVDLYDQANGSGAFNAMVANLPEPGGAFLVVIGGVFLLRGGRRISRLQESPGIPAGDMN